MSKINKEYYKIFMSEAQELNALKMLHTLTQEQANRKKHLEGRIERYNIREMQKASRNYINTNTLSTYDESWLDKITITVNEQ